MSRLKQLEAGRIKQRKDVDKKDKERAEKEYGDVKFADETNKKYPINDEKHIRSAWNYINKEKNQAKYDAKSLKAIMNNIIKAWKEKIDKAGPPSAKKESSFKSSLKKVVLAEILSQTGNSGETKYFIVKKGKDGDFLIIDKETKEVNDGWPDLASALEQADDWDEQMEDFGEISYY